MTAPRPEPASAAVRSLFARRPEQHLRALHRIRALCAALGEPQHAFPALHVTGTNGKTSVTRMAGCLLLAHGLRVGTYTSPHVSDVTERITVDSRSVQRAVLDAALDEMAGHVAGVEDGLGEMLTFFEVLTATAYQLFAARTLDAAVVEVGKGGRVDPTNVVHGRVAVINPVALEHPELGATVAAVAAEKAGIIKSGAVVVSARQEPAAAAVIARAAAARDASLLTGGRDFGVVSRHPTADGQHVELRTAGGRCFAVDLPLRGAFQADNAACALTVVESFLGSADDLHPDRVAAGFSAVRVAGRLEEVSTADGRTYLLDGAHNPAAARALAAALHGELAGRPPVFVLGILDDKDVEAFVAALAPVAGEVVLAQPPSARAARPERVLAAVRSCGIRPVDGGDVAAALATATDLAGPAGLVVVTGSLYTVGAARNALDAGGHLAGRLRGGAVGGQVARLQKPLERPIAARPAASSCRRRTTPPRTERPGGARGRR